MTMSDWENRLGRFIEATDREILNDSGKISAEIAKTHALSELENIGILKNIQIKNSKYYINIELFAMLKKGI